MGACAESHSRIDLYDLFHFPGGVILPGGFDDNIICYPHRFEELFPFVFPVLVTYYTVPEHKRRRVPSACFRRGLSHPVFQAFDFRQLHAAFVSIVKEKTDLCFSSVGFTDPHQIFGNIVEPVFFFVIDYGLKIIGVLHRNAVYTYGVKDRRYRLNSVTSSHNRNFYVFHPVFSFQLHKKTVTPMISLSLLCDSISFI